MPRAWAWRAAYTERVPGNGGGEIGDGDHGADTGAVHRDEDDQGNDIVAGLAEDDGHDSDVVTVGRQLLDFFALVVQELSESEKSLRAVKVGQSDKNVEGDAQDDAHSGNRERDSEHACSSDALHQVDDELG